MRIMNEIYSGMEVIKMYTWERPFEKMIHEARKEELKYVKRSIHIKAVMASSKFFIDRVGLCVTALSYSFFGYPVFADMVFSVAIYIGMIQFSIAIMFPVTTAYGPELLASAKRLVDFLLLEEKDELETMIITDGELGKIQLEKVSASYCEDGAIIACPSLAIFQGALCAVVGRVGSGKSSFLKLLLGELPKDSGSISMNGVISFSSQKPWLFPSTIRQNIIFDQEFEEVRYWETIRVCGLIKDLAQFPNSDKTVVGSRGVTLSGGQRARINLARAVYKKADIYMFDDVLSALDAKVGRHVFDECIMKFLNGKTRIFVTHHLQYLREVDHVIIFNKGILEAQGTLQELSDSCIRFIQTSTPPEELNDETIDGPMSSQTDDVEKKLTRFSVPDQKTKMNEEENIGSEYRRDEYSGSSFWDYLKSSKSYFNIIFFIFLTLLSQLTLHITDYWLAFWSEQEIINGNLNLNGTSEQIVEVVPSSFERLFNSSIFINWVDHIKVGNYQHVLLKIPIMRWTYVVIVTSGVILILIRSFVLTDTCMKASRNLHEKIFSSLMRAPMKFFTVNPPGYTQNIFSKDLCALDISLPRVLLNVTGIISMVPGSLCLILISNYYLAVLIIPLVLIFQRMRKWFIPTFDNFRRIEAREKSPIFTYLSSTIDGITTIRASRSEGCVTTQFDGYQDIHTSATFLEYNCAGAIGLWLEFICNFFILCIITAFIIMDQYNMYTSGSIIGLALFQTINVLGIFQFGIRSYTDTLMDLTSAERIQDYAMLESEVESHENEDKRNLKNWPGEGRISIQNLSLSYNKNDGFVIQNLNLEILPSEKIGIAGRTGAGKSSIISVLFRMTPFEGTILIDGVDTKTIGLKMLRQKLSIIPQEPVLFSATIRYNLDPLQKYTDEKIWKALDEVELKESIKSLDFKVTEGGNNFSVGQKQLICLARALLSDNKIIVLDEATANLDLRTDELIQKTIRRKFNNCTVLTVAHRLTTIIDSDRVLVMDSGRMVEFDHPHVLLQDPNGNFHKLLKETKLRKRTGVN